MQDYKTIEKYATIHVLEQIMQADTIVHPKELEYMDDVYEKLSITPDAFDHMELMDLQIAKSIIARMTDSQQDEVRHLLETMCAVDGFVDKRELMVIDSIFK